MEKVSFGSLKVDNNALRKEYEKAKEKPEFKALVDKLKIPDDILMKYTSLLEESAEEYHNCCNCKGIMHCKNKMKGYAYLPRLEGRRIAFNHKACKYEEKLIKMNAYKKRITLYKAKDSYLDADMKDIFTNDTKRFDTIEYITNFVKEYPENKKGLYLHGSFGSGKSYLVSAAFCELAKKGYNSTIIFWPEFLRDLKTYFGNDLEYRNIIYQIETTPLLLIDDIGAENVTAWSRDEILCPILQYRMDNNLCTFFTSNLSIDDLGKHLSMTKDGEELVKAGRIVERIKQLTKDIELVSKNLRK